jgi:hypothetical protein
LEAAVESSDEYFHELSDVKTSSKFETSMASVRCGISEGCTCRTTDELLPLPSTYKKAAVKAPGRSSRRTKRQTKKEAERRRLRA